MLRFVGELVRQYINPNYVRVVVVCYNDTYASVQHQLNGYNDANSLAQAILQIPLLGGGSNLSVALDWLRTQTLADTAYISVVVTDHIQSSQLISNAADIVRSQGTTIVGVGITGPGRVDMSFLSSITSNRRAIQVGDYSQLVSGARDRVVRDLACFPPETTAIQRLGMFT